MVKRRPLNIFSNAFLGLIAFVVILLSSTAYAFPYKGLDIQVQGTISERYDDNITYAKDDKKEDFITRLGFGLGVKYEGKRRALEFSGRINRGYHARHSDIKNISESLTLNFRNTFSEYDTMILTNTFTHSQVPVSFEEEFGRIRGRYSSNRNRFDLNYTRNISRYYSIIARYANELNNISGDRKSSSLNKIGFGVDYKHSAATVLFVSYDFRRRRFEDAGDTSTHTAATGMRQHITKKVYVDGSIGVDFISSANDRDFTKNYIQTSLTDEIDRNTVAKLSFIRRHQTAPDSEDIFSNWRVRAALTRRLFEKLESSLSGFYGRGTFVSADIKDRLAGADIMLAYEFKENLRGNLTYSYSNLDSTSETRGYTKNTVSSGLTLDF